jgi:hypothetical protein
MGNYTRNESDSSSEDEIIKIKRANAIAAGAYKSKTGLRGWAKNEMDKFSHSISGMDNLWPPITGGPNDFNPVCSGIFTFKDEISNESLTRSWHEMISRFPRYRQKLVGINSSWHPARFVDDEDFDVKNHILVEKFPDGQNGKRELEEEMAAFITKTWDYNKPLWEVKILHNYDDGTGAKSAMLSRMHHTLSDGQGLVASQLTTTSARVLMEKKLAQEASKGPKTQKGVAKLSDIPIVGPKLRAYEPYVPDFGVTLAFFCFWAASLLFNLYLETYSTLRSLWLSVKFQPQMFSYEGPRPAEKEFAFSEKIRMSDIKFVQKAFARPGKHFTLNDVMCAVAAKTIYTQVESVGKTPDPRVSLFIPISVRSALNQRMENQTTGMTAFFRTSADQSAEALIDAAHDEMQSVKRSFWATLAFHILNFLFRVPAFVPSKDSWFLDRALTSAHAVLTNVPGPAMPISIDGHEIMNWTASPPQAGKSVIALGIISYNGHLVWTVTADRKPGHYDGIAHKLAEGFNTTFNEFLAEAQMKTKN